MNSDRNSPHVDKKLLRSRNDRIIGGVCGGFAEYFVVDATIMRIIWIVLGFMGIGVLAYITALIIMQENPDFDPEAKVEHNNSLLVGAGLIILGLFIFSHNFDWPFFWFRPFDWHFWHFPFFRSELFLPIILIGIGVIYIVRVSQKTGDNTNEESAASDSSGRLTDTDKKFERSRTNRMVGGVCGGLAEYLNIDPVIIRLIWVLVTLFSVVIWGAILYIVLLVVIPEASGEQTSTTSRAPVKSKSSPDSAKPPVSPKTSPKSSKASATAKAKARPKSTKPEDKQEGDA